MKIYSKHAVRILMIFMFLPSCREAETKESTKILQQPPFAIYSDSIELYPENEGYYLSRAALLAKQGFHELAGADYKKTWELAPTAPNALELGANLENQGHKEEALLFWKERKKQFPTNREFPRRLSKLEAAMGHGKEALLELESLIRGDSTDFISWFELGKLQLDLGDSNHAQQSLERSYVIEPTTSTGLVLASLYLNKGDKRVLALCDQILQSPEPAVDALLLKGMYYSDHGQYILARNAFESCIKLDYTLIDAHLEKGISYFRERNFAKALQSFEIGLQISKTNADCYFWIGRCYEALNDSPKAKENFERALSLDPGLPEAKERLNAFH